MKVLSNVGKTIWSNDKSKKGLITHETERYCAVCRKTHRCYTIKWEDNSCTKPCEKVIENLTENELIMK